MNNLVENLANAILKSNIAITEIARRSGISRNMIYKILNNEVYSVSLGTVEAICGAINIEVELIISGIEVGSKKTGTKIPVLGSIPAGIPLEAISDIIDYEEIPEEMARSGEFFALKVKGNSMSPEITDGEVAIIRKQDDAENGSICVVMVNGNEATLKRIKKSEQGITLIPTNISEFSPIFFTNEEINSLPVRIIGRVVETRKTW